MKERTNRVFVFIQISGWFFIALGSKIVQPPFQGIPPLLILCVLSRLL